MTAPSTSGRGLALLGLALLGLSSVADPAEAGGLRHKKGQLVAVPTAAQAASPVQVMMAVPVQAAQFGIMQVHQAPAVSATPVQWTVAQPATVVQLQAQAQPQPQAMAAPAAAPAPTIHITVVEAPQAQVAPTAQAQPQTAPQATAQVPLGAAPPQQAPGVIAGFVSQAAPVQQAVPMQLFYVPASHKCSIFCKH